MKQEYINNIYAGWLAKIIGIRFGAPVEGWTYEKIAKDFGEISGYIATYKTFAADDDSNGPIFFVRAVEDSGNGEKVTAQDVGNALLNYAPYENGFFWWGGYGISTEHTAYMNLWNGLKAPDSGSIKQNGRTVAEQIGGQIFSDCWGLINPGNPSRAAEMAGKASSVTHDGNGVYGGKFIAACIADAFIEKDIEKVIEKGLSYIPSDSAYSEAVRAVVSFYHKNPDDWRSCYQYVFSNYGYDRYPGNCHIIPNAAVIILGLLYGEGDFTKTLCITNMCGWDTDCNVGNAATIMGALLGLDGIDYQKWRQAVDDLLICSSSVGSLNIQDIPYGALYMVKDAYELDGEILPEPYRSIVDKHIDACHFEFPGSTHHILSKITDKMFAEKDIHCELINSSDCAHTGNRSLKITFPEMPEKDDVLFIYKKTSYKSKDFSDSRFDPEFSPLVYPGMNYHMSILYPKKEYGKNMKSLEYCPYIHNEHDNKYYFGEKKTLKNGIWEEVNYQIPDYGEMLIDEVGIAVTISTREEHSNLMDILFVDDLFFDGSPEYTVSSSAEIEDEWYHLHTTISQFVKVKGLMYIQDEMIHLSCSDFGAASTGRYDFKDYSAKFDFIPIHGENHLVNVRVQGSARSYAAALLPGKKLGILKNENGYSLLKETDFDWEIGKEYTILIKACGNLISVDIDDTHLECLDNDKPYMNGALGFGVQNGSHIGLKSITVKGI